MWRLTRVLKARVDGKWVIKTITQDFTSKDAAEDAYARMKSRNARSCGLRKELEATITELKEVN